MHGTYVPFQLFTLLSAHPSLHFRLAHLLCLNLFSLSYSLCLASHAAADGVCRREMSNPLTYAVYFCLHPIFFNPRASPGGGGKSIIPRAYLRPHGGWGGRRPWLTGIDQVLLVRPFYMVLFLVPGLLIWGCASFVLPEAHSFEVGEKLEFMGGEHFWTSFI